MTINRHSFRNTVHAQGGFSLIELLICSVILVLVVGTAVLFGIASVKGEATFMETARLDARRGGLSALLRSDLDVAGRSLTKLRDPGAGTEVLPFIPNSTFIQSNGTVTSRATQAQAQAARAIGSGTGAASATYPGFGTFSLALPLGAGSYAINVGPSGWTVTVGGSTLASSGSGSGLAPAAGDKYGVAIERCEQGPCVSFYMTRGVTSSLLHSTPVSTVVYPIAPTLTLVGNSSVSEVSLTAAPIIDIQPVATSVAPMPFLLGSNNRLAGPVSSNPSRNELIIIAGDPDTDPVLVTNHDVVSSSLSGPDQPVFVSAPRRGNFQPNDIVMLVDFPAAATALFRVTGTTTAEATNEPVLSLSGVTSSQAAWGSLFSTDSEQTHTFPVGSLFVKLAPPVQWRLQGTDLLRKRGTDSWQLAEFGVTQFLVEESLIDGRRTYQVSISLTSEQEEVTTGAPVSTFDLVATPRALNLTYNPQT